MIKRKCLIWSLALGCIFLAACTDENKRNLKKKAIATNLECPIFTGWGSVNSVSYDEDRNIVKVNATMVNTWDNMELPPDSIIKQVYILNNIIDAGDNQMFEDIANAKASLELIYKGPVIADSVKIGLSYGDLAQIIHPSVTRLQAREELLRLQLPFVEKHLKKAFSEEGITFERIDYDGKVAAFVFVIDENVYDFNYLKSRKEELRESMKFDRAFVQELSKFTSIGKALSYRYEGNKSGDSFELLFEQEGYDD